MRGMEAPGVEPMDQSEVYTSYCNCTLHCRGTRSTYAAAWRWHESLAEKLEKRGACSLRHFRRDTPHFQIPDPRSHQK